MVFLVIRNKKTLPSSIGRVLYNDKDYLRSYYPIQQLRDCIQAQQTIIDVF